MKNRFLIDAPIEPATSVLLTGEEFHHARVLRLKESEEVELTNGRGIVADGSVKAIHADSIEVAVRSILPTRELPCKLTLAAVLIHPDKFELVLQKATELGVTELIPLISARMEIRIERVRGKQGRWEKIVREATKQCGRAIVPNVSEPIDFREVLTRPETKVIFDADAGSGGELAVVDTILLVGPEGGWTGEELRLARESGCIVQQLGARRLRAETAAIAATTLFAARAERW